MRSMSRQLIFTLHNCCSYVQSNFIKSNMKLARYCFIVLLVGLISSCEVKDIQLVEVESVKVLNVNKRNIDGILNIKLENPNAFGVKVKSADFEIWANNAVVGKAKLTDPFKIESNSTQSYPVHLSGDLSNAISGGIGSIVGLLMGKEPTMRIKGNLKASSFLITKTVEIDEQTDIPISSFIR